MKLPAFWTEESELWFTQAEALFRTKNVNTEVNKFNNVVAQLDTRTVPVTSSTDPREDENPAKLKKRILEALSFSTNKKADRLIAMNGFGDKIPSQGLKGNAEIGS